MRTYLATTALLLAAGCAGGSAGPASGPRLITNLVGAAGQPIGTATLAEAGNGVSIHFQLRGVAPGAHGAHVHAVGKCDPPGFTTAGGHLNTTGKQHGHKNPAGWHLGDVGNLTAKADSTVDQTLVVRGATLAAGPMSLLGPGGTTALVVHANPDDDMTDPAGNAGPRIACGVLVRP